MRAVSAYAAELVRDPLASSVHPAQAGIVERKFAAAYFSTFGRPAIHYYTFHKVQTY